MMQKVKVVPGIGMQQAPPIAPPNSTPGSMGAASSGVGCRSFDSIGVKSDSGLLATGAGEGVRSDCAVAGSVKQQHAPTAINVRHALRFIFRSPGSPWDATNPIHDAAPRYGAPLRSQRYSKSSERHPFARSV